MDYTVPQPGSDARHWYDRGIADEAAATRAQYTDGAYELVQVVEALCASNQADGPAGHIVQRLAGVYLTWLPLRHRARLAWRLLVGSAALGLPPVGPGRTNPPRPPEQSPATP